jgi:rod shape-determining protein MreD
MRTLLFDTAVSALTVLLQTTLVGLLAVGDIVPDLPLLWIVMLAILRGQVPATVAGFGIGLTLDLLGGGSGVLGLNALVKTVAGFLAGYFYGENKIQQTLGSSQFLVIVSLAAAVHNVLYFVIFLQGGDLSTGTMLLRYGLPSTAYTAAAGLIPMFVFSRRSSTAL